MAFSYTRSLRAGIALAVTAFLPLAAFADATPAPTPTPTLKAHAAPHRPSVLISGRARYYNFARSYQTGTTDTQATALGLQLHLETPAHNGLGVGLTYDYAQPLFDGAIVPAELESSLPGTKLSTLSEAYAQYTSSGTLVRIGRQTLVTPWANPADSRLIPVTYEGIGFTQTLSSQWSLAVYRIFRVKNRTSATFTNTSFVSTTPTSGFDAVGLTHSTKQDKLQIWDYQFDNLSNLAYADALHAFLKSGTWHANAAVQIAAENGSKSEILGIVSSHLYGARVDAGTQLVDLALAYDRVPVAPGSYKNGAFVSPYTYGDNADPLFTTLIGASLVEKATPGGSYTLAATITPTGGRVKLIVARGRFDLLTSRTVPKNELYESDGDIAYDFLKPKGPRDKHGLWLHERFFEQDTTVKPYKYEQSRFFADYTW